MLESLKNKKIMVVVAHPDDELLGLGASMNRLINDCGSKVHLVILGEGITSRSDTRDTNVWQEQLQIHKSNIENARRKIGYQSVSVHDFPDNRFDTVALLDIVKVIEKEKANFEPEFIFTHHGGDVNVDHQLTFNSVITACRPLNQEKTHGIITFETPSGTEWRASSDPKHFIPNFYIEVNQSNLNAKISAMECYEFERRLFPHPRSAEALRIVAQRLGIIVGVNYAEAFCLVRDICKL